MKSAKTKKELSREQRAGLLQALKARFEENRNRHEGLQWPKVQAKLEAHPEKLRSLGEMEGTGGEPDVVGHDKKTGDYIFFDCAPESPKDRRSLCYDGEALEFAPQGLRINSVLPGSVITPLAVSLSSVDAIERDAERILPMRRPAQSAEVASAIAFLLSDDASHMTGTELIVDGGLFANSP